MFLPILLKVSDDTTSTEARQEGASTQDPSEKTMAHWTFDVKFPLGTRFTFGLLTFASGEDGDLKMLPRASAIASRSYSLIYIRQYLLRFRSVYRVIHLHRQAHSGYADRDIHHPDIHWSIEVIFIDIVTQPRFI
jgi:hypothetical protein